MITSIDATVGINDAGQLAFVGKDAAGSHAFFVDVNAAPIGVTFASPGSTRIFQGASLNNAASPVVASLDRVSGSPPTYLVRTWNTSTPGTFITVGKSPTDFDSASLYVDVNDSGAVAFSSLINGSTGSAVFSSASSPPHLLATYSSAYTIRPAIANDGTVIWRDSTPRIVAALGGTSSISTVAGSGFTSFEVQPGISADGTVAAFVGNRGAGSALFVAFRQGTAWTVNRVAGEGADAFASFDANQRIGVVTHASLNQRLDVGVSFMATSPTGHGAYMVGLRTGGVLGSTVEVGAAVPVALVGSLVGNQTIQSLTAFDPINRGRTVALGAGLVAGNGVLVAQPCGRSHAAPTAFKKYKQFDDLWASKCLTTDSGTCPPEVGTFQAGGCTLSAFTTAVAAAVSATGDDSSLITPILVRDYLSSQGLQNLKSGTVLLDNAKTAYFEWTGASLHTRVWTERTGGGFQSIIDELKLGRPAILSVPSQSNHGSAGKFLAGNGQHYIVAYAYDNALAHAYGDAAGVLINDPGYGVSAYGSVGQAGWVAGFSSDKKILDANVHVSLADYFAALYRRSPAEIDTPGCWGSDLMTDSDRVRSWFDSGELTFQGDPMPISVPVSATPTKKAAFLNKLVTRVMSSTTPVQLGPLVLVASPVELVITDVTNGTRYVSDASIAQAGDTALPHDENVSIAPVDADETRPDPGAYPGYALTLPVTSIGHTLTLEIHGVANGDYQITYWQRSGAAASPVASGTISAGQVATATFVPATGSAGSPVPALGGNMGVLALLGAVLMVSGVRRVARC